MGCSISRLEDAEAVKLCRDRKKFIKQAVEYRTKFAMGHIAYIDSLNRVSAALCSYVEEDEPREYLLDSYTAHHPQPLITNNPVKKRNNDGYISFSPNGLSEIPTQPKSKPRSNSREKPGSLKINYLMAGGNPAVTVIEERPQSHETYSTMGQGNYGFDGFFTMQTPPAQSSFFQYSPNYDSRPNHNLPPQSSSSFFQYSPSYDSRPNNNLPPPSPRNSNWDFFWNPFSSSDYYGYPNRTSLDRNILDDDVAGLRQVREEEGIPELEEETEHEDSDKDKGIGRKPTSVKFAATEEVTVEDDDDDDDDDEDDEDEDDEDDEEEDELSSGTEDKHDCHGNHEKMEVSRLQKTQEKAIEIPEDDNRHQTPGFTVYVNRRPTSMNEVIKDLESQFRIVVTAASKVSSVLEPSRSYSLHSNETTVMKMLNPVALIRSSSSRSSSSRFLAYKDDESDQKSSCSSTGSHQSTLDRLYAWEKKLYDEVKAGEKVRIAYEKKSSYLKSQDAKGDLTLVEKTRASMRDLHTQIKVSFHSVESISKRIEVLRDQELQPQLLELVQGLCRMWKAMAECHQVQKRILDEAKVLLAAAGGGKQPQIIIMPSSEPYKMARAASNLEAELRNWQATFKSWITSQRSYVQALNSWLHHGRRTSSALSSSPPRTSIDAPPIFGLCKEWSRFLNVEREHKVIDGLDFFAAGVGSVYDQHLREDSRNVSSRRLSGGGGNMEMVEAGRGIEYEDENGMNAEKIMELAMRVLCAGMSVAVSSLTEFSIGSAEGYCELVKRLNGSTAS